MHIQYLVTKNPTQTQTQEPQDSSPGRGTITSSNLENRLLNLDGTLHDDQATELFAAASLWAYSDLKTFASMMCMRGLYGEFVGVQVENEMTFVDTTAYLFLSENRKVAILAFRGMDPNRPGGWMVNAATEMVPFQEGLVHAGFLTANLVVLPFLGCLLLSASNEGLDLAESLQAMADQGFVHELLPALVAIEAMSEFETREPSEREPSAKKSAKKKSAKKSTRTRAAAGRDSDTAEEVQSPVLYVCGHGLGGALAGLAGALFYVDPNLSPLRDNLNSVYTFGAPMFADRSFADKLQMQMGDRVFRHRYDRDPVPLLGKLQGSGEFPKRAYYQHFGCEYVNTEAGGWTRLELANPQGKMSIAGALDLAAFGFEKMNPLWWLRIPFSWKDHLPLNYLRTSQMGVASGEVVGSKEFTAYPGFGSQSQSRMMRRRR
jgi:hypothetical protein